MTPLIELLLLRDEGYRRSCYTDSLGFYTIGIGRMIDARKGGGLTIEEAFYLLKNDIVRVNNSLSAQIPFWDRLNPVRQAVLTSMAFQLGVPGLLGFHTTLKAAREERWADAETAMLSSKWASQTPLRASRLAEAMRTGDLAALRLDEEPPTPA
jgi:lysozyme